METEFTPVRLFFEKRGRSKYISHLDLSRCIQRSIKRSGLPVWYTKGFHPHLYLTFALPISLGYESLCDSMDLRLTQPVEPDEVVRRLNDALPEGLRVLRAAAPRWKADRIVWGDYWMRLALPGHGAGEIAGRWAAFLEQGELVVLKHSKKGDKQLDIRPHFSVREQQVRDGELELVLRVAAGGTLNINPSLVTDAFCAQTGWESDRLDVVRRQLYTEEMEIFE